jgi:hypothetical protein
MPLHSSRSHCGNGIFALANTPYQCSLVHPGRTGIFESKILSPGGRRILPGGLFMDSGSSLEFTRVTLVIARADVAMGFMVAHTLRLMRLGEDNIMNSSKSALLSAIIAAALLLVALGLIFAFLPNKRHAVKAQGNLPVLAARIEAGPWRVAPHHGI